MCNPHNRSAAIQFEFAIILSVCTPTVDITWTVPSRRSSANTFPEIADRSWLLFGKYDSTVHAVSRNDADLDI